ncbi:Protein yippee-like [Actinidia chinensis var. chinensis]|uniref:Protein yippee-like n=1 Tax=Actinidia chinensis var. chinensis TaxID=1590841 RepID=A0A2R6PF78_ACTCC|nr:Protein yippee-like [Actinidia chinensis var. chinensis]
MVRAGIFRNAFNVHVDYDDPTSYRMDGPNTLTRATCHRCRTHLGWEYVYVPVRSILIQPGRFLLKLNKLLVWDGSQILYALTREPIEDGSD